MPVLYAFARTDPSPSNAQELLSMFLNCAHTPYGDAIRTLIERGLAGS